MKAGTSQYFIPQFDFSHAPIEDGTLSIKGSPSSIAATKDAPHLDYKTDSFSLHVQGIPSIGAKSRVETQMKLSIKLVSNKKNGEEPIHPWSYLRIPTTLLARSKMTKSQQQKLLDGSYAAMVSDESKVLNLEARVVCESDENKIMKMCQGCVRRERKRAERRKDVKHSSYFLKPCMMDEAFERDRQRILLFNCEPIVNFSAAGEAIIPTRITCYCRHHNERIGFRVRFTVKDDSGHEIASGETPPIMITDDHKIATVLQQSDIDQVVAAVPRRKRHRGNCSSTNNLSEAKDDHNVGSLITPASSRRSSMNISEADSTAVSSPLLSTTLEILPPLPQEDLFLSSCSSLSCTTTAGRSVLQHVPEAPPPFLPTPACEQESFIDSSNTISPPQTPISATITVKRGLWENVLADDLYGAAAQFHLPAFSDDGDDMSNIHHCRTRSIQTMIESPQQTVMPHQNSSSLSLAYPFFHDIYFSGTCNPCMVNDSRVALLHQQQTASFPIPIVNTITPFQASTCGGIEVTIMGQDFHQDLVLMFGDRAATTIYWSPNYIVCLLPPAERKGFVLLSFKEHSLTRSSEIPPLFEYYEESQQGIIHLTHQVLGVHLVQSQQQSFFSCHQLQQQQDTELYLINLISQYRKHDSMFADTNLGGQNLLHLAAYLNYPRLIYFLLSKNPTLIHSQDHNGLSPLHFSCQTKSKEAIYALLNSGASVTQMSSIGTPMTLMATLLNPTEFQELEMQLQCGIVSQESSNMISSWLPGLFVFAATQYYRRCNSNPFIMNDNSDYYKNLYPQETPLTTAGETISCNSSQNKASSFIPTCNINNSFSPFL